MRADELLVIQKELARMRKEMKEMKFSIHYLSDSLEDYMQRMEEVGNMASCNMENLRLFVYEFKDIMQAARESLKEKK